MIQNTKSPIYDYIEGVLGKKSVCLCVWKTCNIPVICFIIIAVITNTFEMANKLKNYWICLHKLKLKILFNISHTKFPSHWTLYGLVGMKKFSTDIAWMIMSTLQRWGVSQQEISPSHTFLVALVLLQVGNWIKFSWSASHECSSVTYVFILDPQSIVYFT